MEKSVRGTVFYDHPRINREENDVPPLGWYIYTPIRFSHGAYLIAYYAQDKSMKPIDCYCFGLYIDRAGKSKFFKQTDFRDLKFDENDKPSYFEQRFEKERSVITTQIKVKPTTLIKSWGGPTAMPSIKEIKNFPLVIEITTEITDERGQRKSVTGVGLGEYLSVDGNLWAD